MNLAIHDIRQLTRLHLAGHTRTWPERKVVAWVTQGQFLGRSELLELVDALPLRLLEMKPEEAAFFLLFQERLRRRLSHREAVLLFLAERTGSVVLTGEPMVAETAQKLGLPVCSGEQDAMDLHFPISPMGMEVGPVAAANPFVPAVVEDLQDILSPSPIPSSWRVPERDEPVKPPPVIATRRSKGMRPLSRTTQHNPP